jgi:hypothetical protein
MYPLLLIFLNYSFILGLMSFGRLNLTYPFPRMMDVYTFLMVVDHWVRDLPPISLTRHL